MSKRFKALLGGGFLSLFCLVAISRAGAQTCVQPHSGLISWWPGDGNTNDIVDANDGTLQGGATFAAGLVGQAFSFDGIDDLVNAPFSSNLAIGNEMTVDAWVKINAIKSTYQTVFDNLGGGGFADGILISARPNANTLALYVSENVEHTVANFYDIGQFTHIAITTKGGVTKAFKNGSLVATLNTKTLQPTTANTRFGGRSVGVAEFLDGQIDEVEVYNRELSQAEIQAIFNAGSAGKCKATTTGLDHFKCYKAQGEPPNVAVDLEDQFGVKPGVLVRTPELFCNPVGKNGEGIRNSAAHLTCYRITAGGEERDVVVRNQFGVQTLKVKEPKLLCVLSDKIDVMPRGRKKRNP